MFTVVRIRKIQNVSLKMKKAASIKISETLYHDESSLIEQFIWVTPHCERPSDLPIGPMLRDLAEWWQKSKSKYLKGLGPLIIIVFCDYPISKSTMLTFKIQSKNGGKIENKRQINYEMVNIWIISLSIICHIMCL